MTGISLGKRCNDLIWKPHEIASLSWFRILFGGLMLFGVIRFYLNGWITDLYVTPKFFFTYYGFDWVKPFGSFGMHLLFFLMGAFALLIMLGLLYRLAATGFFLLFTYVELIDQTNYLNHYYFISLVTFLLIWVPANRNYSLDVKFGLTKAQKEVASWQVNIFKFQLGIVYFFAGIAKINYHWLIEAQPLSNWLSHQTDLPLIGSLMDKSWTAYMFSWAGCLFDLSVPFLLCFKKTRPLAYASVVFFHLLTGIMFPIGIFPWAMIVLTTVFFGSDLHRKCLSYFHLHAQQKKPPIFERKKTIRLLLFTYISLQLLLPFRYLLYPGKLFWTEQGFRFSWRVMLIEKVGYCTFSISPENSSLIKIIEPSDYLTDQQIKQMSTQPDMILQFAHFLRDEYSDSTIIEDNFAIEMGKPRVYVDAKVSLFNEGSKTFIDPTVDLAAEPYNLCNRRWIMPYE